MLGITKLSKYIRIIGIDFKVHTFTYATNLIWMTLKKVKSAFIYFIFIMHPNYMLISAKLIKMTQLMFPESDLFNNFIVCNIFIFVAIH